MGTNSNEDPTPWISYTNRKKDTTFYTQAPTRVIHFNGERLQPLTSISTDWDRSSNFSYFSTDWWRFQSSWQNIPLLHSAQNDDGNENLCQSVSFSVFSTVHYSSSNVFVISLSQSSHFLLHFLKLCLCYYTPLFSYYLGFLVVAICLVNVRCTRSNNTTHYMLVITMENP